jgi:hypothetical protein
MIKKLVAAAALAGSIALMAPQAALAGQQSISVTLPAGNRVCLDDPTFAYSSARADGYASPGVKFTFLVQPYGQYGYTLLAESAPTTTSWAAEANSYWQPWAFPGRFRTCARNLGTQAASVTLILSSN